MTERDQGERVLGEQNCLLTLKLLAAQYSELIHKSLTQVIFVLGSPVSIEGDCVSS